MLVVESHLAAVAKLIELARDKKCVNDNGVKGATQTMLSIFTARKDVARRFMESADPDALKAYPPALNRLTKALCGDRWVRAVLYILARVGGHSLACFHITPNKRRYTGIPWFSPPLAWDTQLTPHDPSFRVV